MAKIGEGDPRWLVTDLGTEGRNVNRWHWEEMDCMNWAKSRVKQLFEDKEFFSQDNISIKTTKVDAVKGEANLANRKNKLLSFYELDIALSWKAEIKDGENTVQATFTGEFKMPYISDENEVDEFDVNISFSDNKNNNAALEKKVREILGAQGKPFVKKNIASMLTELKNGANYADTFSKPPSVTPVPIPKTLPATLAVKPNEYESSPTSNNNNNNNNQSPKPTTSPTTNPTESAATVSATSASKIATSTSTKSATTKPKAKVTKTFRMEDHFLAPPIEVYNCFLDEKRVAAFTQGMATISQEQGGLFTIFNGRITGENKEIKKGVKIIQKWRSNEWEDNVYSTLTLNFEESDHGNSTKLTLIHEGLPELDKSGNLVPEKIERFWREHFWSRMKYMFGWNSIRYN